MAYHRQILQILAVAILIPLAAAALGDEPTTAPSAPTPRLAALAALLLEHNPDNANPLALEQARELIAGRPGKAWKNCLVEKEVRRIAAKGNLQITQRP